MDTFVELCVGSASVSLSILGQSPPVSFAGSKTSYAKQIIELFGFNPGNIRRFVWNDAGEWANTWDQIVNNRDMVLKDMKERIDTDPRGAHEWARSNAGAAAHLFLVASTFGGFESGGFKGFHKRRPNVDGFIPSRNTIYQRTKNLAIPKYITITHRCASQISPFPAYVYIDPPYDGTTGYKNDLPRNLVVQIALDWHRAGARVVVSENSPISDLMNKGWKSVRLERKNGQKRKNSKSSEEWLTFNFE